MLQLPKRCPTCGRKMEQADTGYVCPHCGKELIEDGNTT
jgi:predicted RNA-binding Zn-ribbon protein involved in translation (DUF1610 family)